MTKCHVAQRASVVLDHLPPRLHVVIASRTDPPLPLPRLRARGDLVEDRATATSLQTSSARSSWMSSPNTCWSCFQSRSRR
jgi:LuxR family maltose regulon positive regulatory protein